MDPTYIIMSLFTSTLLSQGEKNWNNIAILLFVSVLIKYYKTIYDKITLYFRKPISYIHIYSENTDGARNIVYSAIMWYIGDKLKTEVVYEQTSVSTELGGKYSNNDNISKKFPVYDILRTNSITIEDLTYSFDYEKISQEKVNYTKYCVSISGVDVNKIQYKIDVIMHMYKEYAREQQKKTIVTDGFCVYTIRESKNYQSHYIWEGKIVHMNKLFDNLFIHNKIKLNIKNSIDKLLHDDDFYKKFAVPRKLTIFLHGVPGCGKTSFYLTLANEYKMPIYIVSNPDTIVNGINNIPSNSIIVFEEIDTFGIKNRLDDDKTDKTDKLSKKDNPAEDLRKLLELLDGNYTLPEKSIIILTTNYLNKLDPAVYRKGRVDYLIELEKPNKETINDIFKYYYENTIITDDELKQLDGKLPTCEYTNSILLNLANQREAIDELLKL